MENQYLTNYLKAHLRECQLKQVAILETIDGICKKHNIQYWIDSGTLLGAVRHGGFIPWDDDIDICMMKADYDRFIEVAQGELPDNMFLQTRQTDPEFRSSVAKIRDMNSLYIEDCDDFSANYQKGLYVDIFPMIDYPDVPLSFVKRYAAGISKCYDILHKAHHYSLRSFAEFFWFGMKYGIYKCIWGAAKLLKPKSPYFSYILINNGYGIRHRHDSTFPLSTIEFEGKTFPAPADTDAYLTDLYKNYMEIPPEDKRHIHAIYVHPDLG